MALSGSYNYYATRDTILARAFRIIGAIAQGETPSATAVTEAAITMNEIMKEWQADGLQLWKRADQSLTGMTTGASVSIGVGSTISAAAPKDILAVYYRNTASGADTHLVKVTKDEYDRLTPKATTGVPTQWFYRPPRPQDSGVLSGAATGVLYVFPAVSTAWLAENVLWATVIQPLMDFDASTDQPDVPDYLINALVWAVADQLAYEYGLGLSERSMISKKAQMHKAVALSFDQEQGSLFIRPAYDWDN